MSSKAQLSALVERVVDGDRSAFATIDDELSVSTWAVTTDPIVATA